MNIIVSFFVNLQEQLAKKSIECEREIASLKELQAKQVADYEKQIKNLQEQSEMKVEADALLKLMKQTQITANAYIDKYENKNQTTYDLCQNLANNLLHYAKIKNDFNSLSFLVDIVHICQLSAPASLETEKFNQEMKEEITKLDKTLEDLRLSESQFSELKFGDLIDVKDTVGKWLIGKIIKKYDGPLLKFRIHFLSWSHRYDEDLSATERLAPLGSQTNGFIPQPNNYNCGCKCNGCIAQVIKTMINKRKNLITENKK